MTIQSVGSVQFGVEKKHMLKTRMSNFYFVTLGLLAHVVLVWCGVRATGLTTGQVQDKYRTSAGQLQDKYRTTTGHCPTVKPVLRTRLRTLSCPPSAASTHSALIKEAAHTHPSQCSSLGRRHLWATRGAPWTTRGPTNTLGDSP